MSSVTHLIDLVQVSNLTQMHQKNVCSYFISEQGGLKKSGFSCFLYHPVPRKKIRKNSFILN